VKPGPNRRRQVAALVYIAAFAPDAGESVNTLIADPSPGAPVPPILPPREGFLLLDEARFHASFAADLTRRRGSSSPPHRCRGASTRLPARSPSRRGARSQAGIWLPPTTG
jgi:hypothetical protein